MSKYIKSELLNSDAFKHDKDLVIALMKKDESLSKEELLEKIKNYKERKI